MRLLNSSRNLEVAHSVRVASNFVSRAKGLLGEKNLASGNALWIQGSRFVACNSIHTCFMRFAIDAVFVDRDLKVRAVYRDLGPWRMTWPASGATSVFELPAGTLSQKPVEVGDQLKLADIGEANVVGG